MIQKLFFRSQQLTTIKDNSCSQITQIKQISSSVKSNTESRISVKNESPRIPAKAFHKKCIMEIALSRYFFVSVSPSRCLFPSAQSSIEPEACRHQQQRQHRIAEGGIFVFCMTTIIICSAIINSSSAGRHGR